MQEFFSGMPADDYFWWCVAAGAAAVAGFCATFLFLHRKRLMEDMPTSRIRSAPQGYVELEGIGRLLEGPPIIAPLTGSEVTWWRYKIEEHQRRGKNSSWVTIERGTSDDCFLLEDRTGQCVVDPAGAKVIPARTQVWYGGARRPDRGPAAGGGFWGRAFSRYRYTEEQLLPGLPLYALGGFRTRTGAPDAFEEQRDVATLLNKWKQEKQMMALFDVDQDGSVDVREWEAARRMAANKVRAEHVQRAVQTPDVNILARPGDSRPYILSGLAQSVLVRRYTLQAAAGLLVCVAGSGVLLTALHGRGFL